MNKLKTINRKTKIVFETSADYNNAIDFMLGLKLKENWQCVRSQNMLIVPAKTFVKRMLDLYLPNIRAMATTFKYKQIA